MKSRQNPMTLKTIISSLPKIEREKAMLEEDLKLMGCHGLLEWPWCLKDEVMVGELLIAKSTKWEQMLRRELH